MPATKTIIAPSILSADFAAIHQAIDLIGSSGAEWVHCDVMDGHFVPNLTFGPKMVADIRKRSELFLDVHLMVERPEDYVEAFAAAGANAITFHIEACVHAQRLVQRIKDLGCKAGVSLVPSTPVAQLSELLPEIDLVLVMSVNPGFGGQAFLPRAVERIRELARLRAQGGQPFLIAVDGGINRETAPLVKAAGADALIAGNAFFGAADPRALVKELREG